MYKKEIESPSGRESYILVDYDGKDIKSITIGIEDKNRLGRIFDIDVFNRENEQISRSDLKKPLRKCLLCDKKALTCMREKNHTYEELIEEIEKIWENH